MLRRESSASTHNSRKAGGASAHDRQRKAGASAQGRGAKRVGRDGSLATCSMWEVLVGVDDKGKR